jgi:flagellar basal-body rod protein FlgF
METPWLISLSHQVALKREMDAIANNIANVNTPAYKAERMMFTEYLVRPQKDAPLSFVQDMGMMRDLRDGPLTKTDNPLDLALTGDGYFTIQTENGERYSRSGRFQLDADGQITNQLGHPVLSAAGQPIVIPPGTANISIAPDGTVSAGTEVVGAIGVVAFDNPRAMRREANNLYAAGAPPLPAERTRVLQGMLEQSNVNAIQEVTNMIEVHRAYAANQRVLQDEHERIRRAIGQIVGPARTA